MRRTQHLDHGSYQRQLVRFSNFCAYCSEVAGCGTSASLGGHQVSLAASRLACLFKVKKSAKAKRIITESQRASAAHEVDLIIADQMLESFKAFRFHNLHLGFVLLSWAMRSMQSMMSSSFWSCSMRACVGG